MQSMFSRIVRTVKIVIMIKIFPLFLLFSGILMMIVRFTVIISVLDPRLSASCHGNMPVRPFEYYKFFLEAFQ